MAHLSGKMAEECIRKRKIVKKSSAKRKMVLLQAVPFCRTALPIRINISASLCKNGSLYVPRGRSFPPYIFPAGKEWIKKRSLPLLQRQMPFSKSFWGSSPNFTAVIPGSSIPIYRNSNMTFFQDQGYKILAWGGITPGSQDGVFFVFGRNGKVDLEKISCNNKMEETLVKIYKEKGTLRSGALFILSADADKVGSKYYLNNIAIQKMIVEENRI